MKNILDICDVKGHGDPTGIAGDVFQTRTISYELKAQYVAIMSAEIKRLKKWQYILPAELVCFLLWIGSDLFAWDALTLVFGILTIFGIPLFSLIMNVVHRVKLKPIKKRLTEMEKRSMAEMGIPEDTQKMEFLRMSPRFTPVTNFKSRVNLFQNPCENCLLYAFRENNMLCLADSYTCLEIPLISLQNVTKVAKKGWVQQWIQGKKYRKFKKYGVRCHDSTNYTIYYYTIEIHDPSGNFVLCIPNYEMERFTAITGVRTYEQQ